MTKIFNKIIWIIGAICLALISLFNIIFYASLENTLTEHVQISMFGLLGTFLSVMCAIGLYIVLTKASKIKIAKKYLIIIAVCMGIIYLGVQVVWIMYRDAYPGWDSLAVYNSAQNICQGNTEALMHSEYLQRCPQQIPLAFIEAFVFKIFNTTNPKIMQCINAACNLLVVIGIYLIAKEISKKYETNKYLPIVLAGGFIPLLLLSTFIYGDIISLAFSIYSIYFIIKYNNEGKKKYLFFSAISMSISYMARMNSLIFIMAITISLILELIKEKWENKKSIFKILLIIAFVIISMLPAKIITIYAQNKYELNKKETISPMNYMYMGMTEGYRASGWYNDFGAWSWSYEKDVSNKMYKEAIAERIKFLFTHPLSFIKFYTKKNTSMWAENTYGSIYYNESMNFENKLENAEEIDRILANKQEKIEIYQKALIMIIFVGSLIVIIQNRNNLSSEVIVLLITFIGGFLFHNLWEAKSRYIIPYIIVLIPIASIKINKLKMKGK